MTASIVMAVRIGLVFIVSLSDLGYCTGQSTSRTCQVVDKTCLSLGRRPHQCPRTGQLFGPWTVLRASIEGVVLFLTFQNWSSLQLEGQEEKEIGRASCREREKIREGRR